MLTYQESGALMTNVLFRDRIKVSALTYAHYIINEAPSVPAHNTRLKWAQGTYQMPDQVAMQLQPPVVMDAAVQSDGANITDSALQSAVENVVNTMI